MIPSRLRLDCTRFDSTFLIQLGCLFPGSLLIPIENLQVIEDPSDSVVVSVFHRPPHWLEPQNRRAFIGLIERTSDIAIYGHEHVASLRDTMNRDGSSQRYIEAGVLQETYDPKVSSFHVIVLDNADKKQRVVSLSWNTDRYQTETSGSWQDSPQNSLRRVREFQFIEKQQKFLLDNEFPYRE
jgi:hypothetical protein